MKRRRWRRLGITLAILTVVLIVTAIVVPRLLDLNRYHGIIVSTIQKAVGGTVSLERISWGFSPGIWIELDEVSIADASAFPGDLSASRVYVSVSIPPLLHKKIILNQVLLERPDVRLRLAPGRQDEGPGPSSGMEGTKGRATSNDLQRLAPCQPAGTGAPCSPDAAGGSTGAAGPVEVEIRQLAIEKGNVTVEDGVTLPGRRMVRVFSDVDITATQEIPGRGIAFDIALRDEAPAGLGALKAQGTFRGLTTSFTLDHPQLNAHATLSSLHWDALTPYLRGSALGQRLGGSASLTVHYEGDLSSHHRAEGSIDISRMTYTDPSLWHSVVTSADAAIACRVDLTPSELTVEKLVLKLGPLSVRASGRVQDLSERPVIRDAELSSDLPLAELARFIPWKVMGASAATLRPILEAGGRIVIDHAALPEIALAGPPTPADTVLGKTDLTARVSGMSVQPSPSIPRFRNIRGSLRLADGIALVQGLRAQVASVDLPDISAKITNVFTTPKVQAAIQGRLTLPQVPDEELAAFLRRFGVEEASGAAEVDLAVTVDTAQPENFQLKGNVGLREVKVKTGFSPARLEGLTADLAVTPAVVQVSTLSTTVLVPPAGSTPGGRFTAQLQARVDGWRGRPAITLQHLGTSPISLPVYAELVPWEKLGGTARPIKELLLPSGTVAIEALALPPINLSAPAPTLAQLIPRVNAAVSVTDLAAQATPTLPKFESITGHLNLANGVLTATDVRGRVGPLSLPGLKIRVTNITTHPKVAVRAKGPVQVAATSDADVEKLLRQYGLKSLAGQAVIDMRADYDRNTPDDWEVQGALTLAGVRAETHPQAVVVDGLRGRVTVNRAKGMDITAENITAQVNQAPVRLSGKFLGLGTPGPVVNATAYAKQLNLAHVREFFPALKQAGLAGTLDMDLNVYLPYATAGNSRLKKSRLNGMLATRDVSFRLPAANVGVKEGDGQFTLSGNAVNIQRFRMRVNDQAVEGTGHIANPMAPDIQLAVTSPDLDLDRLIPPGGADTREVDSSQQNPNQIKAKAGKSELPDMARRITGQLQVQVKQGRYRGLAFQDLKLGAAYDHGLLTDCALDLGVSGGQISATGTADLRDSERVSFVVRPQITSLKLEELAPVLGIGLVPVTGPISLTGRLQGSTGSVANLLASLEGTLDVTMGPGTITRIGRFGATMARIISFVSVSGLLSGEVLSDLTKEGLSYRAITTETAFDKGSMGVSAFRFRSNALTMDAQGRVDLIQEQMAIQVALRPLGTANTLLGFLPIVGRPLEAMTSIHLVVRGPLDRPDVSLAPGQGIESAIQGGAQGTGSIITGITNFLQRGTGESFRK